jgi:hypothetical protein
MNVKQIVKAYLTENGYDGLYDGDRCGCRPDDLFPCDSNPDRCKAGYIKKWKHEFDWTIVPKKEGK